MPQINLIGVIRLHFIKHSWKLCGSQHLKLTLTTCQQNTCDLSTLQEDAISPDTSYSQQGFVGVVVLSVPYRMEMTAFYTTFPSEVDAVSHGPTLFGT